MTPLLKNPWARTLLPALAGLCAYGGWAYFANLSHGVQAASTAAVVQGSYSFVLTFFTTLIMERLYAMFAHWAYRASIVTSLTCLGLFLTAYSINQVAGTPEILMTIAPGFMIGSIFTALYVRNLAAVDTGK